MDMKNHDEKKREAQRGYGYGETEKRKDKKADTGKTLRGAIPSPGIVSRRLFLDWEKAAWHYS